MSYRSLNQSRPPKLTDNRGAEFEASIQREAQGRSRSRNLKILRRLVPFMAPYKGMLALATVFLLVSASASLAIPAAVREMIDHGFSQENAGLIDRYFLLVLVVAVVLGGATAARFYCVT